MERLTFDGNFCDIAMCRELPCPHDNNCTQKQVWERLKQYEDTGFMPADCADAAHTVHCADCQYGDWDSKADDALVCKKTKDGYWRSGKDFCSFGKKKNGGKKMPGGSEKSSKLV